MRRRKIISFVLAGIMALSNITTFDITSFASETTELTSESTSEAATDTEVIITDEEISEETETVTETEVTTTEISTEETETTTEVTTEEVTEEVTTEDEEDITGFVKLSVDYDTLLSDISFSVYDSDDEKIAVYIVSDAKVSFIDLLTDKDILYEQEDDTLLSLEAGDYYLQMDDTLYDGESSPSDAGVLYDDSKVEFTVNNEEINNPCKVKVTLEEYVTTEEITEEETEVVEATENNETTEEVTEETTEDVTYVTAANETENAVSSEGIVLAEGSFGSLIASNVSGEDTEEETEEETDEEADTEIIVFDHYYSDIDESLVETTDLIVTTSDESIFTKNTNVISNYDNAYIISCESVEEARYVYSYYVDKVDTISDLSKNISVATEDDTEDVADLSDINNSDYALSTLNDIDTKNYSGYIALIDTGADADVNFSVIGDDTSDTNGHGTKMLNLIKENNPDAKVMSIKVSEGSKTDAASIYAGIMLAIESKVSVINLSMVGYDTTSNAIVKEAIEEAINSGITVIGAAGNYNMSAKKFIPGSIDGVIVVGAANEDGTKYSSSNTDADVYVVASSTSEATAIYTGLYTADKLDDERIFTSLQTDTTADTDNEDSEADTEDTEVDYVVNEDGSITFVFDIEYFESLEGFEIADSYSTAATTSLGEVKYSAMPTSLGSSSNYEEGTCTLKNASSSGYGYASGFTHTGGNNSAFTTFLNATGKSASSFNVCCERHWYSNYSDSASYHALAQLNGSKYFRAWVSDLDLTPDDEGKVSCTFTLLVSEKSDFSVTWDSKSTDVSWKVYSSYESSGNVYSVSYSINGGSKVSIYSGVRIDAMSTDTVVNTVASAIASVTSETANLATQDFGGVRNFTPSEETIKSNIYSTISSVIGTSSDTGDKKVTFSWDETEDYQIYEGKIGAWAYANIELTLTKAIDSDYNSFLKYCENTLNLDYYSLVGTTIEVFTDSSCSTHVKDVDGNNVIFTITDEDDLTSDPFEIDAAEYDGEYVYYKETKSGTGYYLDTTVYKSEKLSAGGEATLKIENNPMYDPIQLNLVKVSDVSGTTSWSGEISPYGATYTITGYKLSSSNGKGSQFATWTAKTDSNGKINFRDESYYTSGNLYTDENDEVQFPIGYYTIQETDIETSSGTEINSKTYIYVIYPSDNNIQINLKLIDGDTDKEIYKMEYDEEKGKYTFTSDSNYTNGTEFYTVEPEVWAKLGLFKTDENYIATGYTNNNTVLKTSNAGTSFEDAVFYIYVDSNKADIDGFFPSEYDGNGDGVKDSYTLESVSKITVSDQLGNSDTISVSGLYQVYVNGKPLTITTNATGSGISDYELPYSDAYVAYEVSAPEGFLYNTERITFSTEYWVHSEETLKTVTAPDGTTIQKETKSGNYYYADIIAADNYTKTGMVENEAYYYNIKFTKGDYDTTTEQGDANLNGIQFAVVNRSDHSVMLDSDHVTGSKVQYSDKTFIGVGCVVAIVTTDTIDGKQGGFYIGGLPYGTYEVYELRADNTISVGDNYDTSTKLGTSIYANKYPELNTNENTADYPSMLFDALDLIFTLHSSENGHTFTTDDNKTNIVNHVVRGGFTIYKYDEETKTNVALGGANLKATFELINKSANAVAVDTDGNGTIDEDEIYEPGDVILTFYTDAETGEYTSPSDFLPYGTYEVVETYPPEGYLLYSEINPSFTCTFKIREDGKTVYEGTVENGANNWSTGKLIFYDTVARGDIYIVKKASDTKRAMAYIPFLITSYDQNGDPIESHIVYTDANGVYSSATDYVLHTYNTNYGDNAEIDEETGYYVSDCKGAVGTWFGKGKEISDDLRRTAKSCLHSH